MTRILILVENLSVPFDRRVWQESRALAEAGYEVVVICPAGNGRDTEREGSIAHTVAGYQRLLTELVAR